MTTTTQDSISTVEAAVRRFYAVVADLASTEADLRAVLHPGARLVEHPNLVVPGGAVRDVEVTVAGFRAGRALLREQAFDVHEVVVAGDRASARVTFRATVGVDAGPFRAGQQLVAHTAAFATVRDGLIVEHETFDCYEPFGA